MLLLTLAGVAAVLAFTASTASARTTDLWQSPTGNIRCAYADQVGVGCYTRNNGRWAVIRSFGNSAIFYQRRGLPAGRVLPYGRTWARSTFRCTSRRDGMRCWSTYTGHGFHISRGSARRW
jgi:hypothetical protein